MIEIIEKGTKQIVRCNYCGCKFSYEAEDVKTNLVGVPIRGEEKYVMCPQCNKRYMISNTK